VADSYSQLRLLQTKLDRPDWVVAAMSFSTAAFPWPTSPSEIGHVPASCMTCGMKRRFSLEIGLDRLRKCAGAIVGGHHAA